MIKKWIRVSIRTMLSNIKAELPTHVAIHLIKYAICILLSIQNVEYSQSNVLEDSDYLVSNETYGLIHCIVIQLYINSLS